MIKRNKLKGYLLSVVFTSCVMLLFTPFAIARAEPELLIDYNSGTEKKVVIAGDILGPGMERVYTETELLAFDEEKTYYFGALDVSVKMNYYSVRGISLWDVFDNAQISPADYRGSENFLYTVSKDGPVIGIGNGLKMENNKEPIECETGTLADDRYSYDTIEKFAEFDINESQPIPLVLGFAEGMTILLFPDPPDLPAAADDDSKALRVYFGQTWAGQYNEYLFNSHIYRIVLSTIPLAEEEGLNDGGIEAFSLFGDVYDRANILSGPAGEARKIKGRYINGGSTEYIEGTSVSSLLPGSFTEEYVVFGYGDAEQLVVPVQDLDANKYTLVYATGVTENALNPIINQVGEVKYYFDLYRDGAEPLCMVNSMEFYTPPPPLSVFKGSVLLREFTDNEIAALQTISVNYSAGSVKYDNVCGIPVETLLTAAGAADMADNTGIRFVNSAGQHIDITVGQLLTQERYYFDTVDSAATEVVPALINFDQADAGGRFYIGQAAWQEPTSHAFLDQMRGGRIIIGDPAGSHSLPQAQPAGDKIAQGGLIRLSGAQGQACIYYTLDGSVPTLNSSIYNDTLQIAAPSSAQFTLKAKVCGLGKEDSAVAIFVYNTSTIPQNPPPAPSDSDTEGDDNGAGKGGGDSKSDGSDRKDDGGDSTSDGSAENAANTSENANDQQPAAEISEQIMEQKPVVSFTDVEENNYFYNSLLYVANLGLFSGFADGSFQPHQPLSRAMAATVLWRLAQSPQGGRHDFADVADGVYYDAAVAWAAEIAVILGYSETEFAPQDSISREQFVLMLYRYAAHIGVASKGMADLSVYGDAASISDYALEAIAWAVEIGLVKGVSADILNPQASLSRAQAAVILHRFALWLQTQSI